MFTVEWNQHAVGHGGFHTGRARLDNRLEFNWIFDCGAKKTAAFDAFLKAWTARNAQPIDWLFISHFDTDHVSGLDTLMARTVVRDVMVPYVNDRELAFQLLHEIDRGNLSRYFFELIADPAEFFLSRGAERVTFFGGQRMGREPREDGPRPKRPDVEAGWNLKITRSPIPLSSSSSRTKSGRADAVQLMNDGCDLIVVHGAVGLRLRPYRAPISLGTHRSLIVALQGLVGSISSKMKRPGLGDLAFAIGYHARTASGRAALRKLFKQYAGSSNRSSLSLLSVPYVADEEGGGTQVFVGGDCCEYWDASAAWLNTGDAELRMSSDLDSWKNAFVGDLPRTRVLALPHHGSDKNSDHTLQTLCPDAILVAHVKAGSSKHPGEDVVSYAGDRLACVTDQIGSEVSMRYWKHGSR
jgi:hypothetical protein